MRNIILAVLRNVYNAVMNEKIGLLEYIWSLKGLHFDCFSMSSIPSLPLLIMNRWLRDLVYQPILNLTKTV